MKWKDRCPAVILDERGDIINRCLWERGHDGPHWSKHHGANAPWVQEADQEPRSGVPLFPKVPQEVFSWLDWVFIMSIAPQRRVPSITCPVCKKTSYHPEDIKQGYCGNCHAFTGKAK
jgi:hypothetical protein